MFDVSSNDEKQQLFDAARRGDEIKVQELLKSGTNVNSKNEDDKTALHNACHFGHLPIVKLLLERGAELETTFTDGTTSLHSACGEGHLDVVKYLLDRGANIETRTQNQDTPLILACARGRLNVVKHLLDKGANIEATDINGWTSLHDACAKSHFDVVKYLLDQGANIETRTQNQNTPLIVTCTVACYNGHLDVVKYLLDQGANINATDINGWTSLHDACAKSHFDVVKELLKRGANVHAKNDSGKTPSDLAKTDEIRNLLLDQNKPSPFYEELFQNNDSNHIKIQDKMNKLSQLVGDVHEMKILYTMAIYCMRLNMIDLQFCKKCIRTGLEKTANTCTTEDAIVIYKIILKKARKDNIVSDSDFFWLDNRAEVERMSEADFIQDMKLAIESNTQRLEHRADKMENVIFNVVEHIKYQRKVQAVVGVVCGIVNAFSFGIGGSSLEAFSKLTSNIVDFGDIEHMSEEIQVLSEHPNGIQEATTGYSGMDVLVKELNEHYLKGVAMGAQMLSGKLIEKDFDKTHSAMTALGRVAALASNSCIENNKNKNKNESETIVSTIFPDAVLSEEDENKYLLHCAVKYGDKEEIKNEFKLGRDINELDSQGRTALDLAALTGQLEVMELIKEHGGKFKIEAPTRMEIKATRRAPKSQQYLEQVNNSLE